MTQQQAAPHPVLAALADRLRSGSRPGARTDGRRIALAVEGGGMRGAVSAGMALALHEAGLLPAFDAVYGASAGGITGAWLLSSTPELLRGWADPAYAREMIRLWNPWIGRPVVDVRRLVEHLYVNVAPMDFGAVLANPITLHPLATDVLTGAAADLRPYLTGPAELRLALRASAALPVLAGPPVRLGGRDWFDAGLAESVPYRTALAQGATHVLVLRSRRPGPLPGEPAAPSRGARLIAGTALRRYPVPLRHSYLSRGGNRHADDTFLTRPPAGPALLTVLPDPGAPQVSRLARDGETLIRGFEAGRASARLALEPALG